MYTMIGPVRSRALRVLWMLQELGQPFKHIAAGPHSDDVRAANPAGKVPVLIAEGSAITDSTAILTYLADKHAALTFPAGTIYRARQDSLTHFLLDEFDAVLWTAARHSFVLPSEQRNDTIKDSLRWEFARNQQTLVARMGDGPFLMGAQMTVPDIIATHCLTWAVNARFPVEDPKLVAYVARLTARPAYQHASAA